jgi:anti-sigma factor RsiW
MKSCRAVVPLLDAFSDGELSPERIFEMEEHLGECESCLEHLRFIDAMRISTRRAVHEAAKPSPEFIDRLGVALAAEQARVTAEADRSDRVDRLNWGTVAPFAAAAGVVLALASWFNNRSPETTPLRSVAKVEPPSSMTASIEQLLDELVTYHASPPAPQITDQSLVDSMEPEVGVPVHAPSLNRFGARWEGAGVIPMRNQSAARFRYEVSNHPVTVYVYNAARFPLRAALEPMVVGGVPVHVGAHRGYSIAARERRGVGYAIATDLNDEESAELVASIH